MRPIEGLVREKRSIDVGVDRSVTHDRVVVGEVRRVIEPPAF
jgi:hypothetical protein